MKNLNPKAGFALLYAVLLTGIILTIGLGLSAIIAKQIVLSSTGARSQEAYYIANTGVECVLHWGSVAGVEGGLYKTPFGGYLFDPETESLDYYPSDSDERLSEIVCGGVAIDISDDPDDVTSNNGMEGKLFSLPDNNLGDRCVSLLVYVWEDGTAEVVSTGYSLSCSEKNNPRRVEREIKRLGTFATPF